MRAKISILFSIVLILLLPCTAYGTSFDLGIETEILPEEKKTELFATTEMRLITSEGNKHSIACFDVNENGMIAIGFDTQSRAKVYLYDSSGTFLYGYDFKCEGIYGIQFIGNNLAIFFVRGDYIEIYDTAGNGLDAQRVLDVKENQTWRSQLIDPLEKKVGEKTYILERDLGLTMRSYSRLVQLDEEGNRIVLYDVSGEHNIRIIVTGILFVGFVAIIIISLFRKLKERNDSSAS